MLISRYYNVLYGTIILGTFSGELNFVYYVFFHERFHTEILRGNFLKIDLSFKFKLFISSIQVYHCTTYT